MVVKFHSVEHIKKNSFYIFNILISSFSLFWSNAEIDILFKKKKCQRKNITKIKLKN